MIKEEEKYNVVVTDVDGVLHTWESNRKGDIFDITAMKHYNKICLDNKAKVIVSSTWRDKGLEWIREHLYKCGLDPAIEVIAITGYYEEKVSRGYEIKKALEADDNIKDFIILDDCEYLEELEYKRVRTTMTTGLTSRDVIYANLLFNPEFSRQVREELLLKFIIDLNLVVEYITHHSPVYHTIDEMIQYLKGSISDEDTKFYDFQEKIILEFLSNVYDNVSVFENLTPKILLQEVVFVLNALCMKQEGYLIKFREFDYFSKVIPNNKLSREYVSATIDINILNLEYVERTSFASNYKYSMPTDNNKVNLSKDNIPMGEVVLDTVSNELETITRARQIVKEK